MVRYIATIFDHSGVYGGVSTAPVEETIEELFNANSDEEAFKGVMAYLTERTFDRNKGLISNPGDGKVVQRLEQLMEGFRIVDTSEYALIPLLQRDEQGRVYAERKFPLL
jgi:hypothetical protein